MTNFCHPANCFETFSIFALIITKFFRLICFKFLMGFGNHGIVPYFINDLIIVICSLKSNKGLNLIIVFCPLKRSNGLKPLFKIPIRI